MAPSCDAIIAVRNLSRKVTDIITYRKKKQRRWIFVDIDSVVRHLQKSSGTNQRRTISYSNKRKKKIYGEPGEISPKVMDIIKKHLDENYNFYPWLHNRLGLWKEQDFEFSYL